MRDGEIMLAVSNTTPPSGESKFLLYRLTTAGAPDTSFGNMGAFQLPVGLASDVPLALLVDSKQRTIVAGTSKYFGYDVIAIARLTANGNLDSTFASGGVLRFWYSANTTQTFRSIAIDSLDRIVVLAESGFSPVSRFVARIAEGGTLDTSFGTEGVSTLPATMLTANSIAADAFDRIYIAGAIQRSSGPYIPYKKFAVLRLLYNGNVDPAYGSSGLFSLAFSPANVDDEATALRIDRAGRAIVGGQATNSGLKKSLAIARVTPGGQIDPSFGTGGTYVRDFPTDALLQQLTLSQDESIYASSIYTGADSYKYAMITSVSSNGTYNGSFAGDSDSSYYLETRVASTSAQHFRATVHRDGRVLLLSEVPSPASSVAVFALRGDRVKQATSDTDADGVSDLFWREDSGVGLSWWKMQGGTIVAANYYQVSPEWQIAKIADLDGDRMTDVVWRRASDGATYLWTLSGQYPASFADIGAVGLEWTLVAAGDLNGDATADLVWRRLADGAIYVWLMRGPQITGQALLGFVDPAWDLKAAADIDGDANADLVFRHSTTGNVYAWFMNGTSIIAQGDVAAGTPPYPPTWTLSGVSDFNGDGNADLLWEAPEGTLWVWTLNGPSVTGISALGTPTPEWSIHGIADLDGDRHSDIIFRTASGTTAAWMVHSGSAVGSLGIANPGGSWQIAWP